MHGERLKSKELARQKTGTPARSEVADEGVLAAEIRSLRWSWTTVGAAA